MEQPPCISPSLINFHEKNSFSCINKKDFFCSQQQKYLTVQSILGSALTEDSMALDFSFHLYWEIFMLCLSHCSVAKCLVRTEYESILSLSCFKQLHLNSCAKNGFGDYYKLVWKVMKHLELEYPTFIYIRWALTEIVNSSIHGSILMRVTAHQTSSFLKNKGLNPNSYCTSKSSVELHSCRVSPIETKPGLKIPIMFGFIIICCLLTEFGTSLHQVLHRYIKKGSPCPKELVAIFSEGAIDYRCKSLILSSLAILKTFFFLEYCTHFDKTKNNATCLGIIKSSVFVRNLSNR